MKINKLVAHKVYGFLDLDIKFDNQLTFLIGINGAGKTTALKILLGYLGPSFNYINEVRFEKLRIECSSRINEKDIIIEAEYVEPYTIVIYLHRIGQELMLGQFSIQNLNDDEINLSPTEIQRRYDTLQHQFISLPIIKEITSFVTPIFLGLDRRVFQPTGVRNKIYPSYSFRFRTESLSRDPMNTSLKDIQLLIYDHYRKIVPKQAGVSQQFKNKILGKFFEYVDEQDIVFNLKNLKEITSKRKEILNAVENLDVKDINSTINNFFDKIEENIKKIEAIEKQNADTKDKINLSRLESLQSLFANSIQLSRFNEVIKFSQEYQNLITSFHEPTERLKKITSKFFKEGKKELYISGEGELKIKVAREKQLKKIFELSSGEKQLMVIIAHLIFREDQANDSSGIFIIDEPELSLHMAWQEIFVDALLEASPKTQFILATHAPSIVAKDDWSKNARDLTKNNN